MAIFNNKEEGNQSFSMQMINNIGQGTIIEGNIKTEGDIRIDGKITGDVKSKGRCVIGSSCVMNGNLEAINGNIDGNIKGDIVIKEVLKVTKSAKIEGNITTKKLIVDEGAVIQAKIKMLNSDINTSTSNIKMSNEPQAKVNIGVQHTNR